MSDKGVVVLEEGFKLLREELFALEQFKEWCVGRELTPWGGLLMSKGYLLYEERKVDSRDLIFPGYMLSRPGHRRLELLADILAG